MTPFSFILVQALRKQCIVNGPATTVDQKIKSLLAASERRRFDGPLCDALRRTPTPFSTAWKACEARALTSPSQPLSPAAAAFYALAAKTAARLEASRRDSEADQLREAQAAVAAAGIPAGKSIGSLISAGGGSRMVARSTPRDDAFAFSPTAAAFTPAAGAAAVASPPTASRSSGSDFLFSPGSSGSISPGDSGIIDRISSSSSSSSSSYVCSVDGSPAQATAADAAFSFTADLMVGILSPTLPMLASAASPPVSSMSLPFSDGHPLSIFNAQSGVTPSSSSSASSASAAGSASSHAVSNSAYATPAFLVALPVQSPLQNSSSSPPASAPVFSSARHPAFHSSDAASDASYGGSSEALVPLKHASSSSGSLSLISPTPASELNFEGVGGDHHRSVGAQLIPQDTTSMTTSSAMEEEGSAAAGACNERRGTKRPLQAHTEEPQPSPSRTTSNAGDDAHLGSITPPPLPSLSGGVDAPAAAAAVAAPDPAAAASAIGPLMVDDAMEEAATSATSTTQRRHLDTRRPDSPISMGAAVAPLPKKTPGRPSVPHASFAATGATQGKRARITMLSKASSISISSAASPLGATAAARPTLLQSQQQQQPLRLAATSLIPMRVDGSVPPTPRIAAVAAASTTTAMPPVTVLVRSPFGSAAARRRPGLERLSPAAGSTGAPSRAASTALMLESGRKANKGPVSSGSSVAGAPAPVVPPSTASQFLIAAHRRVRTFSGGSGGEITGMESASALPAMPMVAAAAAAAAAASSSSAAPQRVLDFSAVAHHQGALPPSSSFSPQLTALPLADTTTAAAGAGAAGIPRTPGGMHRFPAPAGAAAAAATDGSTAAASAGGGGLTTPHQQQIPNLLLGTPLVRSSQSSDPATAKSSALAAAVAGWRTPSSSTMYLPAGRRRVGVPAAAAGASAASTAGPSRYSSPLSHSGSLHATESVLSRIVPGMVVSLLSQPRETGGVGMRPEDVSCILQLGAAGTAGADTASSKLNFVNFLLVRYAFLRPVLLKISKERRELVLDDASTDAYSRLLKVYRSTKGQLLPRFGAAVRALENGGGVSNEFGPPAVAVGHAAAEI